MAFAGLSCGLIFPPIYGTVRESSILFAAYTLS